MRQWSGSRRSGLGGAAGVDGRAVPALGGADAPGRAGRSIVTRPCAGGRQAGVVGRRLLYPQRPDVAGGAACPWATQKALQPFRYRSRAGVFNRVFAGFSAEGSKPDQLMVDTAHLKAHLTAASLRKEGLGRAVSGAQRAA